MDGTVPPWQGAFTPEERATYDLYRRPGTIDTDWTNAALIIVDATMAFFGPNLPTIDAARQVRTACGQAAWQTLPALQSLQAAFRAATRPVVYSKPLWAREAHVGGTTAGRSIRMDDDTIMAAIAPAADEYVIDKSKPSAFFGTAFVTYLVRQRVRTLVIAGGTTSGCVRVTAVDASSYGLDVVVAEDACFDRAPLSHAVALYELDVKHAAVLPTAEIVDHLGALDGR